MLTGFRRLSPRVMVAQLLPRRLQLRKCTSLSAIHQRQERTVLRKSTFAERMPYVLSEEDEGLANRYTFDGIEQRSEILDEKWQPNGALAWIRTAMAAGQGAAPRVSVHVVLAHVVVPLEKDDHRILDFFRQNSDEDWPRILLAACGFPLSTIDRDKRAIILDRLWTQFKRHHIALSTDAVNARLRSMLENETQWDVFSILREAEISLRVTPDAYTFRCILERLAWDAQPDSIQHMRAQVYEMARRGFAVDVHAASSILFAHALQGYHHKADSLAAGMAARFEEDGEIEALAACARAAAATLDMPRLRSILRLALENEPGEMGKRRKRLRFEDRLVFELIWLLADRGRSVEHQQTVQQMLDTLRHSTGFFRRLFRETERHIAADHFPMAMLLIEDIGKVHLSLVVQKRSTFVVNLSSFLARRLVASAKTEPSTLFNMANRMHTLFGQELHFQDDLLFAALLNRAFSVTQRFEYLTALVDNVDRARSRPHVLLPILVKAETVHDRLQLLFRATRLGYSKLTEFPIEPLHVLLLQPLFSNLRRSATHRAREKEEPAVMASQILGELTEVLTSHGFERADVFRTLLEWWRYKKTEEPQEEMKYPSKEALKHYLKTAFYDNFREEDEDSGEKTSLSPSYVTKTATELERLVQEEQPQKIANLLRVEGQWPETADVKKLAPMILKLIVKAHPPLQMRDVKRVVNMIALACQEIEDPDESSSVITTADILRLLHLVLDVDGLPAAVEYAFELRRLFPHATPRRTNETYMEYRRLVKRSVEKTAEVETTDLAIFDQPLELLKQLQKLELSAQSSSEVVSDIIVRAALVRFGWSAALTLWQRLAASLFMPNGCVSLIRHAIKQPLPHGPINLEAVLNRAQTYMPRTRLRCLYAFELFRAKLDSEAEKELESLAYEKQTEQAESARVREAKHVASAVFLLLEHSLLTTSATLADKHFSKFIRCLEAVYRHTAIKDDARLTAAIRCVIFKHCARYRLLQNAEQAQAFFTGVGYPPNKMEQRILAEMREHNQTDLRTWTDELLVVQRPNEKEEKVRVTGSTAAAAATDA